MALLTPRERILRTLAYDKPDRLPVIYSPSAAGLYVHGRKLLDLFAHYPSDNSIAQAEVVYPPAETIDAAGRYHELKTDAWGTEWEYLIFGVAGHPWRYPINDWARADAFRFPELPAETGAEFEKHRAAVREKQQRYFVCEGWVSIFERLHALHPMDGLLMALATGEPGLLRFLDRLEHYWNQMIDYYLAVGLHAIWFADDWGTQQTSIISPEMFREIFRPMYARMFARVKQGGGRVFFHSCGYLGPIFDELLDLGIDLIWPQIGWFEGEPERMAMCKEREVAFYVHPDRQKLIPLGTPREIRDEIKRYAKLGHKLGGGMIFHVEMENDAPFENVKALVEAIDEFR